MPELSEKNSVNIIQLTDSHIFPDTSEEFDGINTASSLETVIQHINASAYQPDLILMTGDLVHEPSVPAYNNLVSKLKKLGWPVFCLAGNHDDPDIMRHELAKAGIANCKLIILNKWIIFMLDTFLPGSHSGKISKTLLELLGRTLRQYNNHYALVCLHHPPISVGSAWMDRMGLKNPDALFSVIKGNKQVRGILWGHIHQEFYSEHKGIQLMSSPSTCVQFLPCTDHYVKDETSLPGYRQITLTGNGKINTLVVRVNL